MRIEAIQNSVRIFYHSAVNEVCMIWSVYYIYCTSLTISSKKSVSFLPHCRKPKAENLRVHPDRKIKNLKNLVLISLVQFLNLVKNLIHFLVNLIHETWYNLNFCKKPDTYVIFKSPKKLVKKKPMYVDGRLHIFFLG